MEAVAPDTDRYDVQAVRRDFPTLERTVHDRPLVYLDNAATAQRPRSVIEAVSGFYADYNANVHRGIHQLSVEASDAFESARGRLARFINARSEKEIVFTRGTTEAVNLVAQAYLRPLLRRGDEILITHMEHHSNIVPWQLVCEQTGAVLKVAPINSAGELLVDELETLITERTRLIGIVHVSNALGTINPVAEVCRIARSHDVPVLVDGAQALPHLAVDVQALGCDFYCLSGHKMYGPTGIGALWARESLLEAMPPWHGGGEMIERVTFEGSTWAAVPHKFEAGTPNIAGAIGLGAAVDYLDRLGPDRIGAHEHELLEHATRRMTEIEGLNILGTAAEKAAVVTFTVDGIHPHDLGTIIDHAGVALRTGHHCAMPVMQFYGVPSTARISCGLYNTREEIDVFIEALEKARAMLA